jgi:hypothetical protein
VEAADEVEGGGVGLFKRPPVRVRKAVKRAWVEERRSGVWGALSDGGDMRLEFAECLSTRGCWRQSEDYRVRSRVRERGEVQWRERIESIMGASGRRRSGVIAAHVLSECKVCREKGSLRLRD